jgi:hypothetical protein
MNDRHLAALAEHFPHGRAVQVRSPHEGDGHLAEGLGTHAQVKARVEDQYWLFVLGLNVGQFKAQCDLAPRPAFPRLLSAVDPADQDGGVSAFRGWGEV